MAKKGKGLIFAMMITFIMTVPFMAYSIETAYAADVWPTKPITIVVPFSPGGGGDRMVRNIAPFLKEELGVPILVENKPGGSGIVGTTAHLKSDPADGSKIIYQLQPYLTGGILRGARWKLDDFAYIANMVIAPESVWVKNDSPYKTFEDLLMGIKEKGLSYSYLPGSFTRVGGKMLQELVGGKGTGIPYDGGGPQRMALVGGHVDYIVSNHYGTLAGVGDKARPLAIFSDKRDEVTPDLPTVNEELAKMGMDKRMPDISNIYYLMVKREFKQKYPGRFDRIAMACYKAINNPKCVEQLKKQKIIVSWWGPVKLTAKIYEAHEVVQQYKAYWQRKKK